MMQTFAVQVPNGVRSGEQFQASLDGQLTMVIVPAGSGPGSTLHVQIPIRPSRVQKYAVTIPQNISPGQRFQASLGGQLVWLHCPRNLGPGKQMLVDANSAAENNGTAKTWPPPIAVPAEIEDGDTRVLHLPHHRRTGAARDDLEGEPTTTTRWWSGWSATDPSTNCR